MSPPPTVPLMADIPYRYKIRVKLPDKSEKVEDMTVSGANSKFGSAMAIGKVVRYYDSLKAYKEILDYRIMIN